MAEIDRLLTQLEEALVAEGLHTPVRPADEAFQSTQPFFIDTMSFPVWLQYVLVERLRALRLAGQPLPSPCHVAEMAETLSLQGGFPAKLVPLLKQIDDAVNAE